MFRAWILASALLVGCGSEARTEPKVIKIFNQTPSIKLKTLKQEDCSWEKVKLQIFNNSSQRLTFEYHKCAKEGVTSFTIKNGNEVFANSETGELHILSIWKTGPHSEEAFLKSLISEKDNQENCKLIQDEQKNWKIGVDENNKAGWVLYPSLTAGCSTYYVFDKGWVFKMDDGIAIGYLEVMNKLAFYDLSSITYESRG